jgi:predicted ATPase/DNA-binding SARP family transcriptional activator
VELTSQSGEATLRRWPMVRKLLAVLVVHAGATVSVDRLSGLLWGSDVPADEKSAVHNLVFRLRTAVREAEAAHSIRIATRAPGYLLEVDDDELDSAWFVRLAETAREYLDTAPSVAADLLDQALALWRGPAFAEFADEEFVRAEAARLEELRLVAATDRVEAALRLGACDEAIGRLEPLLAADSLRERPRQLLMRALHGAGRSVEALAVYREFRTALADELGLDPSPELRELEAAIIRHDPGIGGFKPVSARHNLPQERGELVGRSDEVSRVADAVRHNRLVTLTGVGGVGKTRLALHVANTLVAAQPDGVWLCELAAVGDDAVDEVVAAVLGAKRRHGVSMVARIAEYLHSRQLLLVLDNCEHVRGGVGRLVDAVLRDCPRVRVLATSRERLDVDGERVLPVAPLASPAETAEHEALAEVGSVALFVQRASAASPLFALTEENCQDVAEICRRLDGLPLALELVAPKVRALRPAEIVARLDRRLQFVRTAGWVNEHRHRTLRAAIDWSYQLLDEPRRAVFDRVSVFVGPFTLEAAERVAGRGSDVAAIDEALTALVDRSMLDARPDRVPTRYSMLETLRQYGRERLAERGWEARTRRDHAVYHAELADDASSGLAGPDPVRWIRLLDTHLDELRTAHHWALANDPDLAMRLAAALFWYVEQGLFLEGASWAERAIAVSPPTHPLLPLVASVAAFGATKRGDLAGASRLARIGLAASEPDDPVRRYGLFVLGDVALFEGRLVEAGQCYSEAARLAVRVDDVYTHACATINLAIPLAYQGDRDRALAVAQRGRSVATSARSPNLGAWAEYALGEVLADIDPEQAIAATDAAIGLARQSGNRFVEGVALVSAASLRARHGEPREALERFSQVVEQWHRAGNWTQQWTTLRNVIDLFVRLSADEPAVMLMAALRASRLAAPLFGCDAARLAEADNALRARLSKPDYRRYQARGNAMTDDAAVLYALTELHRLRARAVDSSPR